MTDSLPHAITVRLAERRRRLRHYLWHQIRNNWNRYPATTRQRLAELGWQPPRPAKGPNGELLLDNNAGEDFLFMHRLMLEEVGGWMRGLNTPHPAALPCWRSLPWPDDPEFPVPAAWETGSFDFNLYLITIKSASFYRGTLMSWEGFYREPETLRRLTLGQYGALIEATVHNVLHLRWADEPEGIRPHPSASDPQSIDPYWDDPEYDYLGDPYSSHVNPTFWCIHGWVAERVEEWRRVNRIAEIQWQGNWTGESDSGARYRSETVIPFSQRGRGELERMEEAVRVIGQSRIFYEFHNGGVPKYAA
ncbi:Tat pathway signal protein [Oceanibacterium hippocampi]|uniref:Uncharacterized protein n=1 Tax=Oceanibacterium hippocampi TaxID=745714 RepID=A0A1Y5U3P5_9PROT|nr:Tat pathway signal protein [Oceanibacterium hippocampi]SLN76085.1 hypothetical protein OCH7691_04029 [Oceanibacterium hippocampi]